MESLYGNGIAQNNANTSQGKKFRRRNAAAGVRRRWDTELLFYPKA
jgi:hypothetical protein